MTPLLISTDTIKTYGVIDTNVDDKLITAAILMCQDIHLQQLIGTDLYKELCDQVDNDNVSTLNATLLKEYIENYLLNLVIADGVITFNYRLSNKGVVTSTSDNQFAVDKETLSLIEQKYRGQADFYGKRISQYLCEKSTQYPLYYNGNNDISDIQPKSQKYNSNIYLGNVRRKNNKPNNYPYCKDC